MSRHYCGEVIVRKMKHHVLEDGDEMSVENNIPERISAGRSQNYESIGMKPGSFCTWSSCDISTMSRHYCGTITKIRRKVNHLDHENPDKMAVSGEIDIHRELEPVTYIIFQCECLRCTKLVFHLHTAVQLNHLDDAAVHATSVKGFN